MKHLLISFSFSLTILLGLLTLNCTNSISNNYYSDPNQTETNDQFKTKFKMSDGKIAFYTSTKETAPVIKESQNRKNQSGNDTSWGCGDITYELFMTLRDFDPEKQMGKIDQTNMYKVLYDVGDMYNKTIENIKNIYNPPDTTWDSTNTDSTNSDTTVTDSSGRDSSQIDTANSDTLSIDSTKIDPIFDLSSDSVVPIQSPFDFGTSIKAYAYAYDYGALSKKDNTIYALITWIWDESNYDPQNTTKTYGVIEANFNDTTGDIEVDLVGLVDYEENGDHCYRMYLRGNEKTHNFTIKFVLSNGQDQSKKISLIGKGVSKSDNPDDYFLLKIKSTEFPNDSSINFEDGRYFKFNSSANEDSLRIHADTGFGLGDFSDPMNYADSLESVEFFRTDGSDNAVKLSDFLNSSVKLKF